MKALVAYFSATGTTAGVAKKLADVLNCDIFPIMPEEPYTPADLDWMNSQSRSSREMKEPDSRVEIKKRVANMKQYDTLFVGFPIWWYVAPHIINSFLEQYDLSGKTVHLFATSGGSGMGRTAAGLKPSAPGAVFGKAERFPANVSETALEKWAKK